MVEHAHRIIVVLLSISTFIVVNVMLCEFDQSIAHNKSLALSCYYYCQLLRPKSCRLRVVNINKLTCVHYRIETWRAHTDTQPDVLHCNNMLCARLLR